jgi:hypothetical protein
MNKKDKVKFYLGNQNLPTPNTPFEWTPEMVEELEVCKKNLLHFAENHFYIINIDEGRQKIKLHKFQKRLLRAMRDNRFVVCTASRQIGKTTVLTIFCLWLTCFFQDQSVLILANKEDTAIEILSRIRFAFELLPNYLKPGVKGWGKTAVEFENGCKIEASTTSTDSGRGKSISCLVVDEMAHVDDLDQFFESVYPTISSSKRAKMFAISTPKGKNNLFFRLYDGAVKGTNGWYPEKVNWDEVPGRDEKWKQLTLQTMGSLRSFQQEFENYFFDDSGEVAFSEELFKLLEKATKDPIQVFETPKDKLEIWEMPQNGKVYSIGVDVAEGIGKNASTVDVLDITDIKNIRQVASYWTNTIEPKHFAVKVLEIARKWGNPPLCIERNNHGGQVIDVLWDRYQYPNIVTYIPNAGDASQKFSDRKGIMSHTNSKYHAVMNMRYYVGEKRFVHINNKETIAEYKEFKRRPNGTWGADDDHFDDRVISVMWALMILEPHITKDYFEVVDMDPQGKPLKMIPNFDTYIRTSDIVIPRRNYNSGYQPRDTNFNRYDFAPSVMSGGAQNEHEELFMQGWRPLQ